MSISCTDDTHLTVADALDQLVRDHPDRPALSFTSRGRMVHAVTAAQLYERAHEAAAFIASEGGGGRAVVLLHPPGIDFMIDLMGCMLAGAHAVPLAPKARAGGFDAVFASTGAAFAMTEGPLAPDVRDPSGAPVRVRAFTGKTAPIKRAVLDDIALIQFTSGTSGRSRGVAVTHGMIAANMSQIRRAFDFRPEERAEAVALWLPHFHDMGLFGRLQCLFSGVPCHLMSPFEFVKRPLSWLELVARTGASVTGAPNFAYRLCTDLAGQAQTADLDLRALRVAFCGAEPVCAHTLSRFADAFVDAGFDSHALTPCYGMAEATLMASCAPLSRPLKTIEADRNALAVGRIEGSRGRVLVSCGVPCEGSEIAVLQETQDARLGGGEVGEIAMRGPNVASRFLGAAPDRDEFADLQDGGGRWLRTGDRGVFVEGELYVTGRIKALVIVNGRNLDAHDLEACATEAHPALAAAACRAADIDYGERPELMLELAARFLEDTDPNAVFDAVQERLEVFADLRAVRLFLVPRRSLPRTTSGKLQRSTAFEMLARGDISALAERRSPGSGDTVARPPEADLFSAVMRLARNASGLERLEAGSVLRDQGADSLAVHRLVTGLRALTGDLVPLDAIYGLRPADTPLAELAARLDGLLVDAVVSLDDDEARTALDMLER